MSYVNFGSCLPTQASSISCVPIYLLRKICVYISSRGRMNEDTNNSVQLTAKYFIFRAKLNGKNTKGLDEGVYVEMSFYLYFCAKFL